MKPRFNYPILRKGGVHSRRKERTMSDIMSEYEEEEWDRRERNMQMRYDQGLDVRINATWERLDDMTAVQLLELLEDREDYDSLFDYVTVKLLGLSK
jgi:hypothetical protein